MGLLFLIGKFNINEAKWHFFNQNGNYIFSVHLMEHQKSGVVRRSSTKYLYVTGRAPLWNLKQKPAVISFP